MCDTGEGDKQLVEIRARVLPAFLGLRCWRMRHVFCGEQSHGCREETSTSICTAWDLEVARRWLEGSWAWRGVAPFGHAFSKISRDVRRALASVSSSFVPERTSLSGLLQRPLCPSP